jgi:hypothetical protein
MNAPSINSTVNAIHALLLDFDLYDADGNAFFKADIDFIIKGRRRVGECNIRIDFSDSSHGTIYLLIDKNTMLFPIELNMDTQSFSYVENICLRIAGSSDNSEIGNYQLAIFPRN